MVQNTEDAREPAHAPALVLGAQNFILAYHAARFAARFGRELRPQAEKW